MPPAKLTKQNSTTTTKAHRLASLLPSSPIITPRRGVRVIGTNVVALGCLVGDCKQSPCTSNRHPTVQNLEFIKGGIRIKCTKPGIYSVYTNPGNKHKVTISAYKRPGREDIRKKYIDTLRKLDKKTQRNLSIGNWTIKNILRTDTAREKKRDKDQESWNHYSIQFISSKSPSGISSKVIDAEYEKKEAREIKLCRPSFFSQLDNPKLSQCVDTDIMIKGNVCIFNIGNLMLNVDADNICHNIAGANQIYIAEHYFKTLVTGKLMGTLYDGASKYINENCAGMNKLYSTGKLKKDQLDLLFRVDNSSYAKLSSLTIAKTGLTYYEKFGYMAGILNEKQYTGPAILDNTYAGCFLAFLNKIEQRVHILELPLADIIKEYVPPKKGTGALTSKFSSDNNMAGGSASKKTKTKKTAIDPEQPAPEIPAPVTKYNKPVVTLLAKRLPAIKHLLTKLRPDIKFQITHVRDLYKYISGDYTQDFYCQNYNKTNAKLSFDMALIVYSVVKGNITHVLDRLINGLIGKFTPAECVKFLRIEHSADNAFILEQHARFPAVKKEYLAEFITRNTHHDISTSISKQEDSNQHGAGTKSSVTASLTCEQREDIRSRVDKLLGGISQLAN